MSNDRSLLDILRAIECFASLSEMSLRLIEAAIRTARYRPGEIISREGDPGLRMFIVESGTITITQKKADGTALETGELHAGDVQGAMSLFETTPLPATHVATTDVRLWVLDYSTFQRLLEAHAHLARRMLAFMSHRVTEEAEELATLRYVPISGADTVYASFSPHERRILDTINHKVAASESLPELIDFLFEMSRGISPSNRMALAFVEEDGRRVVAHYARADYEPLRLGAGYAEDLRGSSLKQVIESGQPRIIGDLHEYLGRHPSSRSTRLVVEEGLRSSMTCPLTVNDRHVGLLFRSSKQPGAYDAHQVRLWQALADRISQTVAKAYRIEQLTQANRAYTEMLGFVSHELKSPVASMVTDANLLAEGYLGELTDVQRGKLRRLIGKGGYILGLVREYLDLARIESDSLNATMHPDVDFVADVVEPAMEMVEALREERGMTFVRRYPDTRVGVECDPDLMKVVMINLIGNGVKYGREGGELRVTVQMEEAQLSASVWNEGPGFPERLQSRLFRKFSRLDTPELKKQKGTGVGLYSVWRIVHLHGGRIRAQSEESQWAEFHFTLPQPIPKVDLPPSV